MKRTVFPLLVFVMGLAVIAGCKKKPQVEVQAAGGGAVDQVAPPRVASTEIATGELRELLLELERVHFAFDTAELVPTSRAALDEAAQRLMAHDDVVLYVDGHTDRRGTAEYNMGLGDRRARSAVNYLTRYGVPAANLRVTSFGEESPRAVGGSELAHAKNRRVEFRLIRGDIQFVLGEGTPVDDRGRPIR